MNSLSSSNTNVKQPEFDKQILLSPPRHKLYALMNKCDETNSPIFPYRSQRKLLTNSYSSALVTEESLIDSPLKLKTEISNFLLSSCDLISDSQINPAFKKSKKVFNFSDCEHQR